MSILVIDSIHTYYGKIQALKGISLEVEQGEIVTLIGANGAGKTTTLRTISGLLKPRHGTILFEDEDLSKYKAHEIVFKGVAMVPEGRGIFSRLSVQENLDMGAYSRNDKALIAKDLELVFTLFPRLKERRRQVAGTLSGGEQQMLATGRARWLTHACSCWTNHPWDWPPSWSRAPSIRSRRLMMKAPRSYSLNRTRPWLSLLQIAVTSCKLGK